MEKQLSVSILIFLVLNYTGCTFYSVQELSIENTGNGDKISRIDLINGEKLYFDKNRGTVIEAQDSIAFETPNGTLFYPASGIKEYRISIVPFISQNEMSGSKIYEVLTQKRTLISFNDSGVYYDSSSGVISGEDLDGKFIIVKKGEVYKYRVQLPESISTEDLKSDSSIKIKEVVTKDNNLITFRNHPARYIKGYKYITGVDTSGMPVKIYSSEIAKVEKKSVSASTHVVNISTGVAIIFLIAGFFAVYSFTDGFKKSGGRII